jgi:N-methylhydantoinase A
MTSTELQIGADIGGTFTDIVFQFEDGRLEKRKVPTTPDDFGRAIVEAVAAFLQEKNLTGAAVREVLHATTVATNAILERKGAKVALITTEGFRDVLELRRIRIPFSYDLTWEKPAPMAEREYRFEAAERVTKDGEILKPFDPTSLDDALESIRQGQIDSVAVSCLHSYKDSTNEKAIGEALHGALPDIPVSLSHEILPEAREFERTSTTVVNAYVAPLVGRYLDALRARFKTEGIKAPILVMQSAGGLISAKAAAKNAVTIIESGPAAGVVAASRIAKASGHSHVITFDMGGTTSKASIIEADEMLRASEYEVGSEISVSSRLVRGGGYLLKIPVIDISEVGAGGGSIARIDDAGALRVGPRSASSVPGPACYGKGNDKPTVTDANLVLGYLAAGSLAGGSLSINIDLARAAIEKNIAGSTGMTIEEAAWGIYLIANSNMVRALKTVSVERGRDPADFLMMAFGGAGPLHAAALAHDLGIKRVLIPPAPGVFSAFGLLAAPIEQHAARSVLCSTDVKNIAEIASAYRQLRDDITERLIAEGLAPTSITLTTRADVRYRGQSAEITIPFDDRHIDAQALRQLEEAFESEYQQTFGHRGAIKLFEFVTARIVGSADRKNPANVEWVGDAPAKTVKTFRHAYFGPEHGLIETEVVGRAILSEKPRSGPLLIQEYDTTIVVPPLCSASVDQNGNVIIDLK